MKKLLILLSFLPIIGIAQTPKVFAQANSVYTNKTADTLNGVACDCLGPISTWTWAKVSGPGLQTLAGQGTSQAIVAGLQTGSYIYSLTVTNGQNVSAMDTVGFTVAIPIPPPVCDTAGILKLCPVCPVCPIVDTAAILKNCPPPANATNCIPFFPVCPVCPVCPAPPDSNNCKPFFPAERTAIKLIFLLDGRIEIDYDRGNPTFILPKNPITIP